MMKFADFLAIALKVPMIYRIKTDQCGEQTPISFGYFVSH
jgi:hypothetical protein